MYSEEIYKKQKDMATKCLLILRDLMPEMKLLKNFEWKRDELKEITYLSTACLRSSESAMVLVAHGQLWDSEIMMRSVLEGTLKFCYILQFRDDFNNRYKEYSENLWQISLLKDHRKIEELLNIVADPSAPEWLPFRERRLDEDSIREIETANPQRQRRALETRWGFTGLAGELSRSGDKILEKAMILAHNYAIASHIQHADIVGVSVPMDRDLRSPERRESIHLAHAVRLISDALSFFQLRLTVANRFVGLPITNIQGVYRKIYEFTQEFKDIYQHWLDIEYAQQ